MRNHFATATVLATAAFGLAISCTNLKNDTDPQTGAAWVTAQRLAANADVDEWLSVGNGYHETRFSGLDTVNTDNVGDLGLAWFAEIDTERGQESTPVVVDGVMYITTAWSMVKAYDIHTGELIWSYDPKVDRSKGAHACCDVVNRGVAVWEGKIFVGALDGRLIALDSQTGAEVWSVQTTDTSLPYTITGAPRVVNGKVIIGNGGGEYRVRGYVSAYDADTAEMDWRWYSVPGNPADGFEQPELEAAAQTWNGEWWTLGGGGTMWDAIIHDPELNLIYVGTGNGTPWNQSIRSPGGGDNLYLSSIVALEADTGKYVWHYQTTPGESWDYTAAQPLMITELDYPEGKRKVIMQAPKNGFFYVLDAASGELLSAEKFAPATWATHVDMATGRPVEAPEARYDRTGESVIIAPAALGMHNWHPMAYSEDTGFVYIPVTVSSALYAPPVDFKPSKDGWNTGISFRPAKGEKPAIAGGVPPKTESYILAWDPVDAREVWRIPNEEDGASGLLATAGGLIFSGNHDGEFVAYDAITGERLWSANTQARIVAAPSTYTVDGAQHVAVLVGARGLPNGSERTSAYSANNSRLLVYAAGGDKALPDTLDIDAMAAVAKANFNPPLLTASNETVAEGEGQFATHCSSCHGATAVPGEGSIAPDLRYSATIASPRDWAEAVLAGNRAQRGMPGFYGTLSLESSDAVRHYIIKRANDEKAAIEAGK